jgi:hypothetical protein
MVHRFAVFALLVATAEAGKKTCEQWCSLSTCNSGDSCARCKSKQICNPAKTGTSHPMCTSVVNGDVLACSPFCACDSPVCMPWCGEMQCAKEDMGDPDREMLKNPSCTGCAEVDVHCESAGDFSTKAPATGGRPNGGKLIGEEEAEEEEEKEECSLEHLYAEHEMLSAAVARQDQELRRYAAALADTDRHDSNVDSLHDWAHTWEEAAEYNSQHFTRAPAATAPPECAGNWEQCGGRMSPTASNPGGKWMGPTCCAGAPAYSCKNFGEWFSQCRPHA